VGESNLYGHWSTLDLYLGAMEAQWVFFLENGSGWWEWQNALAFEAIWFWWHVPRPGTLEVHTLDSRGGRSSSRHGYQVHRESHWDERHTTTYTIASGLDVLDRSVTVLELRERDVFSPSSAQRYAFVGHDVPQNPWF
jgi:hypothetical protein